MPETIMDKLTGRDNIVSNWMLELTGATGTESIWSRASREANMVCDGLSYGLQKEFTHVHEHLGEDAVKAGVAGTLAPAFECVGLAFRPLPTPLVYFPEALAVGTMLAFRSDGQHRLNMIGESVADCWNNPHHYDWDASAMAQYGAPLVVDGMIGIGGGFIGSRIGMGLYGRTYNAANDTYKFLSPSLFDCSPHIPPRL